MLLEIQCSTQIVSALTRLDISNIGKMGGAEEAGDLGAGEAEVVDFWVLLDDANEENMLDCVVFDAVTLTCFFDFICEFSADIPILLRLVSFLHIVQ